MSLASRSRWQWQLAFLLCVCSQANARTIIYSNNRCFNDSGDLIRCPINPLYYIIPISVVCGLLLIFLIVYAVIKIQRNIKEYREIELGYNARRTNPPAQQA